MFADAGSSKRYRRSQLWIKSGGMPSGKSEPQQHRRPICGWNLQLQFVAGGARSRIWPERPVSQRVYVFEVYGLRLQLYG